MSRSRDIANLLGAGSVILDGAPSALDTLNELAAAIGDDANYASTVTTALNNRVLKTGGDTITVESGTTVPLTIQNNGTGNSFIVNDESSDTTPFVIDASGNVGIGTSTPLRKLNISGGGLAFTDPEGATRTIHWGDSLTNIYPVTIEGSASSGNGYLSFRTNTFGNSATERMRIDSSGRIQIPSGGIVEAPVSTNAQTGTSYTLVLTDAGRVIEMNNASGNTLTVPTDASVNFPVGTVIDIFQTGTGQTTVGGAGVTINARPGLKLSGQWATATLIKRATNTWLLTGSLSA